MYQLTDNPDTIRRVDTGATIPRGHRWWDDYTKWLDAGNTPLPVGKAGTVEETRTRLQEAVTARRWEVEQGGITFQGSPILTTTADQNRITTVLAVIGLGLESVDFKTAAGWTTLTADDIRGIATVVGLHTQLCFTAERAHHEAIDRLRTVEELESYDVAQGWPEGVY